MPKKVDLENAPHVAHWLRETTCPLAMAILGHIRAWNLEDKLPNLQRLFGGHLFATPCLIELIGFLGMSAYVTQMTSPTRFEVDKKIPFQLHIWKAQLHVKAIIVHLHCSVLDDIQTCPK